MTWTDFKSYAIYRSMAQVSLGPPVYAITEKATTSYTVTGLSPDTTYYFTIRVYDTGGLSRDFNQVQGKTGASTQLPIWLIAIVVIIIATVVAIVLIRKK